VLETEDQVQQAPATAAEPRVQSAVPTFVVADVGTTARWYADHLGFRIAGTFPPVEPWGYASIVLGDAELMLLRVDGYQRLEPPRPEWMWDAYLRTNGVHALYERVRGREFVTAPLRKQSYGDWEFDVRDPNGYTLVFGGDVPIPDRGSPADGSAATPP
jgi:catechol 2,3-dioxygenase-like lactoylglutathione lyase family enzyme